MNLMTRVAAISYLGTKSVSNTKPKTEAGYT